MDIRTKLVFTLVAVALLSMSTLGVVTVWSVTDSFEDQTSDQLSGLAVLKQEALEQVIRGWEERVALVASRTNLRLSLAERVQTGSSEAARRIERILDDAATGSPSFLELWVHDVGGGVVARVDRANGDGPIDPRLLDHSSEGDGIRFVGVTFREDGEPLVGFTAPLELDGALLGYLHAVLSTDEIAALSDNYDGLGQTGETIVVAHDADGLPRTMHPLRFPPPGGGGSGYVMDSDAAAVQSLFGRSLPLSADLTDYRGERVYVTTRSIPQTGWGLVVKIDWDEQQGPIERFRQETVTLAVTLAAFAILAGAILGIRFAQPIHFLAETAAKIAEGDLTARSGVDQHDEVGLLARTFDQMAESLEVQVGLLSEFRLFFDVSIDMMCIASTDGYFKKLNPAFTRELGWSEEVLLSRPFITFVHPDDHRATAAEIQKLATGQPTIRFTNRFLCVDGSYKRVRWNSYPEPETGRLYAIARVRSEQPDQPGGADSSDAETEGPAAEARSVSTSEGAGGSSAGPATVGEEGASVTDETRGSTRGGGS